MWTELRKIRGELFSAVVCGLLISFFPLSRCFFRNADVIGRRPRITPRLFPCCFGKKLRVYMRSHIQTIPQCKRDIIHVLIFAVAYRLFSDASENVVYRPFSDELSVVLSMMPLSFFPACSFRRSVEVFRSCDHVLCFLRVNG